MCSRVFSSSTDLVTLVSLSTALVRCVDVNPIHEDMLISQTCTQTSNDAEWKSSDKCFMLTTVVPQPRCRSFLGLKQCPSSKHVWWFIQRWLQPWVSYPNSLLSTVTVLIRSKQKLHRQCKKSKQRTRKPLHSLTTAWGLEHGSPVKSQAETNVKTLNCMKRSDMTSNEMQNWMILRIVKMLHLKFHK